MNGITREQFARRSNADSVQETKTGEVAVTNKPLVLPLTVEASDLLRELRNELGETMRFRPDLAFVLSALVLVNKRILTMETSEKKEAILALKQRVQEVAKQAYSD